MAFIACGLNHKTAPLEIREQVALLPDKQNHMLEQLMSLPFIHEASILSTCNRTEIYCDTSAPEQLAKWLSIEHNIAEHQLQRHLYLHREQDGIRHTLRVASGLDSMMLGEPQILGQLKRAYQQACDSGAIKSRLRGIFEHIFSASKRIRHLSGIGNNPVSVAYAAVQLLNQTLPQLKNLKVLIIGAGETSSLVCKYLHQAGVEDFTIASRTQDSALKLATGMTGKTASIGDIPTILHQADVVISATACPLPFINHNLVAHAMQQRNQRPMVLLDLAVPRDIEPEVSSIKHVHLFNIDDLQQRIEDGMEDRRDRARHAEELIECELENYIRWHRSLRADELICQYRHNMQQLAQEETTRALRKISAGHSPEAILQELSTRLLNKLTHHTTNGFRSIAREGHNDMLALTQHFFNLAQYDIPHEEVS